ncbi:MAG: bifunctional UDP-N-acetylglucosamine diphosphorylase/glucosamine-1-phosphate N-acetyltransferase GlmU [Bifidobacteriaceae bacterium]|jgi:bifunctional UDP-N-acetylglucosamine pyrophosphorylase/glucosamine-1-phosphate N-acetyltransferase|nr:bifunctional UDP-N-acetylglucosamine diphosphorylase/glucosamine-1-phosphate N-acetyltransferase GlmU [Bifidobacteriaceae bacterium]
MTKPAVIILAAGEGTRMKSTTPKVLHQAAGRSLLAYAVEAAQGLEPGRLAVVVRHGRDLVAAEALRLAPDALIVDQDQIPGTGRAVQCALAALDAVPDAADPAPSPPPAGQVAGSGAPAGPGGGWPGGDWPGGVGPGRTASGRGGQIVVMSGDAPLVDADTLKALVQEHNQAGNGLTLLTALVPEPFGYGRIVRDQTGRVARVVEERDATPEQAAIGEVNASIYVFEADVLRSGLAGLGSDNDPGEVYLTDVVADARAAGRLVGAVVSPDPTVVEGVNDRAQLARASARINRRRVDQAMIDGVTVIDPASTWIGPDVRLEPDVTLLPGTTLAGRTSVAGGGVIGPFTTLTDTRVGAGATVDRTVANGAEIGAGASVGPFTHLRAGTALGGRAKAGSFTELKAAQVGEAAKVPHLAYVGDAQVGAGANVGAGTIFANYDGVTKSKCVIGPAVRIGSNNVIVAPVEMGAGAYSGAGAVVRGDVPPGSLAVSAGSQRVIDGWTLRKRPGSDSALAAERALGGPAGDGATAGGAATNLDN